MLEIHHASLWKSGVSGTALAFDGYFSKVTLPKAKAQAVRDEMTLEAWVALGAYYTGVTMDFKPASHETLTVTAWVALDTYPYNNAPLVHQSKGFGREGWYVTWDRWTG